ncbi:MAG: pre-peptidase C-terminal domain-containing protein, partial [Sulfurovum sp.]|nr:pre-peptidase C-terminal domain-containing protein [Sulfurovum sp.]
LDDYGNTIGDARTVSLGNTTLGNINVAGDEDYFKIVIPSAGTLTVKTTGSTDTYGYLLDASNSEIESNDDGGLDRNFQISKFITTAGTYYVKVKHHSATETGPYSLVVHFDDHNNTQDGATPINPTSTTPGSFEIAGDKDWFKIVISRAGVLEVETTGRIDTNGTLYDASGTQIASNENSGTGNNFKITQTVTAGTYYVKVKHHSTSGTGDYSLVSRFTPSITTTSPEPISDDHGNTKETATLIELNTTTQKSTTSGNIEVAADKDYFEINITRAGKLVVRTTGTTDTQGYLYDASGTQVASDDNSGLSNNNFRITYNVTGETTGIYYIEVRHSSPTSTGRYSLFIQLVDDNGTDDHNDSIAAGPTPVNPNSETPGSFETERDPDWFKIVIPEAGTLIVGTASSIDTYGYLYNAEERQIGINNNHNHGYEGGTENFKITHTVTAGIYYVKVRHHFGEKGGHYTFISHFTPSTANQVQGTDGHNNSRAEATTINPTSTTSGSIETAGDADWFKITIPDGSDGTLVVETTGQTDTQGYLYDDPSSSSRIAYNDDNGSFPNFKITQTVTAGTTYYVKVKGYTGDPSGNNSNVIGNYSLVT